MINRIEGVIVTPLRQIKVAHGNIYHAIKVTDSTFKSFGEAYFSNIEPGAIKGWKRHNIATLNIIVPSGAVEFVIFDDRKDSLTNGCFQSLILSEEPEKYVRLTVPPGVWMAFRGVSSDNSLLLDIMDIAHDDGECDRKSLADIPYIWE